MANALYLNARDAFARGQIDWLNDDLRVAVVDPAVYTVDIATDEFFADIPGGAVEAVSTQLQNPTVASGGSCDADPITLVAVPVAAACVLVLYADTGNPATSRLIAYLDTGAGLPVTPDGSDITVTWAAFPPAIFQL